MHQFWMHVFSLAAGTTLSTMHAIHLVTLPGPGVSYQDKTYTCMTGLYMSLWSSAFHTHCRLWTVSNEWVLPCAGSFSGQHHLLDKKAWILLLAMQRHCFTKYSSPPLSHGNCKVASADHQHISIMLTILKTDYILGRALVIVQYDIQASIDLLAEI